jgi:hypothetical protein
MRSSWRTIRCAHSAAVAARALLSRAAYRCRDPDLPRRRSPRLRRAVRGVLAHPADTGYRRPPLRRLGPIQRLHRGAQPRPGGRHRRAAGGAALRLRQRARHRRAGRAGRVRHPASARGRAHPVVDPHHGSDGVTDHVGVHRGAAAGALRAAGRAAGHDALGGPGSTRQHRPVDRRGTGGSSTTGSSRRRASRPAWTWRSTWWRRSAAMPWPPTRPATSTTRGCAAPSSAAPEPPERPDILGARARVSAAADAAGVRAQALATNTPCSLP